MQDMISIANDNQNIIKIKSSIESQTERNAITFTRHTRNNSKIVQYAFKQAFEEFLRRQTATISLK